MAFTRRRRVLSLLLNTWCHWSCRSCESEGHAALRPRLWHRRRKHPGAGHLDRKGDFIGFLAVVIVCAAHDEEEVDDPHNAADAAGEQLEYAEADVAHHEPIHTQAAQQNRYDKDERSI